MRSKTIGNHAKYRRLSDRHEAQELVDWIRNHPASWDSMKEITVCPDPDYPGYLFRMVHPLTGEKVQITQYLFDLFYGKEHWYLIPQGRR
jgi:hypothetical protein